MSVGVIVVAGGTGERFGGPKPKPLADLNGKPVIAWTLDVFERSIFVDDIVLVVHADWLKDYLDLVTVHGFAKVKAVVVGGATRTQSVRQGLAALDSDVEVVLVHDGVRPLLCEEVIKAGLTAVKETGAAIAAVALAATIKVVDPRTQWVTETLDRDLLREIQTPQVFTRELLERSYRQDGEGATDDATLVERLGVKVAVFKGSPRNIKITTPEDMLVARAFMAVSKGMV